MLNQRKPEEYVAIAAWHKVTGSFQYYTNQVQEKAAETNAPLNAIYHNDATKRWVTTDDLKAGHWFHEWFARYQEENKPK